MLEGIVGVRTQASRRHARKTWPVSFVGKIGIETVEGSSECLPINE
jgi:hypothetical protein